jgi:diketogulonate reductase-like aldo/keto reductase
VSGLAGPTAAVTLNNGVTLPRLGLGVFRAAQGGEARRAVLSALEAGYRHVDTAQSYGNERDVGMAIRESGLARQDIFVTSKLYAGYRGFDAALQAFDQSLARLGLEQLDLFLLHWPVPESRLDSWRALERVYHEGRVRAIGVSNFMVHHLEELARHAEVPPAVNQIEVSPFLQQREVRDWCRGHEIVVEAYSPLTKGHRLTHPGVVAEARALARTPAQVLLRWALQHDLVALPKSTRPDRIRENAALFDFELDAGGMSRLDALEEGLVTGWDPRQQP